ncbi:release factor glutamine methyltransferase [Desulfitispora alkaliphila]|uniref:peptide chain release factor N(5)-glutamine methyltransferase n=1 Tax=Desulfitispora alkaliphila TaxID=622674 RepID=UPI003D22C34B
MNVSDAQHWGRQILHQGGLEGAQLEAQLLLARATSLTRVELYTKDQQVLTEAQLAWYKGAIEERSKGYPLQYLLGEQSFMGLRFRVTPQVLIPRSDTEILVEEALEHAEATRGKLGKEQLKVADVCTGSGAIAVSIAVHAPDAQVWALDISQEALAIAQQNAADNGASDRITFMAGDLLEPLMESEQQLFHMILSNPPYISTEGFSQVEEGVKQYEPRLALAGGADGLDFYRRLVVEAPPLLTPGGVLAVEIGWDQQAAVEKLFIEAGFEEVHTVNDYQGHPRVVMGNK